MKRNYLICLWLSCGILGCSLDNGILERTNMLELGMTKSQAISVMGTPAATRASGEVEYLTYFWRPSCGPDQLINAACPRNEIIVKISNGSVEAFGGIGDFDFSKNPSSDINFSVK